MASHYLLFQGMSEKGHPNDMIRMNRAELEKYICNINAANYERQRNYLGGSTNLSEYITRGVISLPYVRDLLLVNNTASAAYKLINELAWREYWHLVWQVRGKDIFEYIKPLRTVVRPGIPLAVIEADTGIKALDNGIRQLQQTGYIHNHMRMWLAGLICNVAHCDWRIGADWMHSNLIDGDYASNHLSWQWVAGSYTGKAYLPQQDNINTYTRSIQHGTYLDQPYELIADMATPDQLRELVTVAPKFSSTLPSSTITISELASASEILLYSPWTLDPQWHPESSALRLLLIDTDMFESGQFSQNVIDSIIWFSTQIQGMHIICAPVNGLASLSTRIIRKYYAGISEWPGQVETADLLYPQVPAKFYPSFSSFWKQAQK